MEVFGHDIPLMKRRSHYVYYVYLMLLASWLFLLVDKSDLPYLPGRAWKLCLDEVTPSNQKEILVTDRVLRVFHVAEAKVPRCTIPVLL